MYVRVCVRMWLHMCEAMSQWAQKPLSFAAFVVAILLSAAREICCWVLLCAIGMPTTCAS
jgi:hypothetical protein